MSDLLAEALAAAAAGIPVVPLHTPLGPDRCTCNRACDSIGKHPRLMHGLRDASTDTEQVAQWWKMWPAANVGLCTGVVMDVVDIDTTEGLQALLDLLGDQGLPGPAVATGSGGWHAWVAPTGLGNRVGVLPGVDWRGRGGYVVAPPSLHASGHRYRWSRPRTTTLPACPDPLRRLVEGPELQLHLGEDVAVHTPSRYAEAAVAGEVAKVLAAQGPRTDQGQQLPGNRNDTLNRSAYALGRLVGAGLLTRRAAEVALGQAAREIGLGAVEAARTVHSGLTAGTRNPRHLADQV
jgi:Bifunctional DNA primase/polymerase, N-terminal